MQATDFAAMSDSEINRWAAEQDGFGEFYWSESLKCFGATRNGNTVRDGHHLPRYATSADACLALLERWGLDYSRDVYWCEKLDGFVTDVCVWRLPHFTSPEVCRESDTCKFPRAALNAACAAKEAQDAAKESADA